MLNGPNSPVGNFSLIQTAEMQLDYVLQIVNHVNQGDLDIAVVSHEALNALTLSATKQRKEPYGRPAVTAGISTTMVSPLRGHFHSHVSGQRWNHLTK